MSLNAPHMLKVSLELIKGFDIISIYNILLCSEDFNIVLGEHNDICLSLLLFCPSPSLLLFGEEKGWEKGYCFAPVSPANAPKMHSV